MTEFVRLNDAAALDEYVTAHPRGHYMQTTLWGRLRTEWEWVGLILRDNTGVIRAAMALMSRRLRGTALRQFYAPRGPVFDDLYAFHHILAAAKEYILEHHGFRLRIDPPIEASDTEFRWAALREGFIIDQRDDFSAFQARFVYQTRLTGLTETELLGRFRSKTRYNIRLAQRRGVTVRRGTPGDIPVFWDMMRETACRDGFIPKPEDFFHRLLVAMPRNARLYLAEKEGRVLAGAIGIIQGKRAWYAYGCSYTDGRADKPNELLQWTMLRAAMAAGCEVYDFRGVEGSDPADGLHRFKQGFDSRLVEYAGQLDLVLRPGVNWAVRILSRLFAKEEHRFARPVLKA